MDETQKQYNARLLQKLERIVAIRGADSPHAEELARLKGTESPPPPRRTRTTEKTETQE